MNVLKKKKVWIPAVIVSLLFVGAVTGGDEEETPAPVAQASATPSDSAQTKEAIEAENDAAEAAQQKAEEEKAAAEAEVARLEEEKAAAEADAVASKAAEDFVASPEGKRMAFSLALSGSGVDLTPEQLDQGVELSEQLCSDLTSGKYTLQQLVVNMVASEQFPEEVYQTMGTGMGVYCPQHLEQIESLQE